jgi:dihydroorotase
MGTRIQGGHLIDPANGIDEVTDVFIDDEGFIAGIGTAPSGLETDQTIDASGRVVCPGLIDLRARLHHDTGVPTRHQSGD